MRYQLANTDEFLAMALAADRAKYNRCLDVSKLNRRIDPNGTHICKFSMIHEHIAGRKVDPHMRTLWLLKMKNKSEPVEVSLDIAMDTFNKLSIHSTHTEEV